MRFLVPAAAAVLGMISLCVTTSRDPILVSHHTVWLNAATLLARLFFALLPALLALGVTVAASRRTRAAKVLLSDLFAGLMLGLLPAKSIRTDGGTTIYSAVFYRVTFYHALDFSEPSGYRTGTEWCMFPWNYL